MAGLGLRSAVGCGFNQLSVQSATTWTRYSIFLGYTISKIMWASTRENLSSGFANNTGADQPAHPRSLISAFVIRFFESTICKLATGEISIL